MTAGAGGRHARIWLGGLTAAILLLFAGTGPPVAGAATVQDATCPGPITQNLGAYQLAQPFTALRSGVVSKVEVGIYNDPATVEHVFEIRTVASGVPTGTVLATATVSADDGNAMVPFNASGLLTVNFTSPAAVRAGQPYALVYRRGSNDGPFAGTTAAANCDALLMFTLGPADPQFRVNQEGEAWVFTTFVTTDTCAGQTPTIVGTSKGDTLRGTNDEDVILGRAGADTIKGLGDDDVVCGGAGADRIAAGSGGDTVLGHSGADTISGGKGSDRLTGHGGNDRLRGGGGKDVCRGGKGRDGHRACEVRRGI